MKTLYLAIMQNLVELSGEDPLKEDSETEHMTRLYGQMAWHRLARRALELGFGSDEILRLSRLDSDQEMARRALLDARPPQQFDYGQNIEDLVSMIVKHFNQAQPIINQKARLAFTTTSRSGEPLKRRCGRQYSNAYANDRPFFTPEHFSGDMSKGADITSLFVRRSVFLAFWGKYDGQSSDSNIEDADHQDQQMADELDVLDRDTIDTSDGDQDMAVPSSSGEDPNQDSDMTDGLPRAWIESAQGGEMRNSLPAARPGPVRNSGLVRKRHPRGIVEQWKRREKNKKEQRGPSGTNRSSALTTFVPDRESVDPDDTARMPLEYAAKMTILLRQDGEWKEVKECRRSDIVESIDEVRRDFPDQHWFLYDKDGRGIDLKDCLTHENDFVCLNTDSSGFPAELIS